MVRETHRWHISMRRYSRADGGCAANVGYGYHNGQSPILETVTGEPDADGIYRRLPDDDHWPRTDSRWPVKCDHCAYVFTDSDHWQTFTVQVFVDNAGKEYGRRDLPPGAMWFEDEEEEYRRGPDGRSVHVILPDGSIWAIDGPCSNCGLPNDRGPFDKTHRCWVRHGIPPQLVVDKQGRTCSAGAGSIVGHNGYHGFLGCNGAPPGYFT